MEFGTEDTRALLDGEAALETSLVELVVAACECSEDAGEIADKVDHLLASGRVTLRP